mgnify:CR=1 FL=1
MRFFLASLFFTLSATLLFAGSTSSESMGLVEIPELKALSKPVRATGESKELFFRRVRALHDERAKEIFPVQKEFRLAVEDRNRRLLRGEVKQSHSLIDPSDPLFSAYKAVYT